MLNTVLKEFPVEEQIAREFPDIEAVKDIVGLKREPGVGCAPAENLLGNISDRERRRCNDNQLLDYRRERRPERVCNLSVARHV